MAAAEPVGSARPTCCGPPASPRRGRNGSRARRIWSCPPAAIPAKQWFTQQDFRYSRTPGTQRVLDVFLFKRREGFCGHYASAFTALMRAAGVPARVVSGYLGGTWVRPLSGGPYLDLRTRAGNASIPAPG